MNRQSKEHTADLRLCKVGDLPVNGIDMIANYWSSLSFQDEYLQQEAERRKRFNEIRKKYQSQKRTSNSDMIPNYNRWNALMNYMYSKIKESNIKDKSAVCMNEIYDIQKLDETIAKINEIKSKEESVLNSSSKGNIDSAVDVVKQEMSTQTPPNDPFLDIMIEELDKLPEKLSIQAKYEVQQVFFKYRMAVIANDRKNAVEISCSPFGLERKEM